MKTGLKILLGLTASIMFFSCAPNYESQGDKAYEAAQEETGDAKRRLQKEAYMYYRQAVQKHPDKIGPRLRNRFVEMVLKRAILVLTEGSHDMDAIPLLMEEIDSALSPEVNPEHKSAYARFLSVLADSNITNHQKIYKGIGLLDKAVEVAPNPSAFEAQRNKVITSLAKDNYEMAKMEFEAAATGRKSGAEDTDALIRAEYHTKLALYYDNDYPGAGKLLSTLYKKNINNYSAYDAVVQDKPDTMIYDQINEHDILLAVTDVKNRSGTLVKGVIYNYSYNPLRLRAEDFALVDHNGKRYKALGSSKINKEILDQEHEAKFVLVFKKPGGRIKKLAYENGDHYTEKNFY
ncbi:MAG: hypothetical protein GF344_20920 [Chitinivibrionales bacterium]|nr:hypothetical protein [Chitinivibrionales bacterium]MBD3359057.1 hypothetical protein [Chitinivibrionales bacterium]